MFLTNLLSAAESAVDSLTSSGAPQNLSFWDKYGMLLLVGGFFILLILGMVWSSRKRRKQQEETAEKISSLKAGTEIETIGGIFGTIVQMNKKEGTFILETGAAGFGKTYICFDRNAIARIIDPVMATKEELAAEEAEDAAPEFEPVAEETTDEKADK